MIAFVRGNFVRKSPATVFVDVHGVGYELQVSLHTYSKIRHLDEGTLLTYFHVREDAQTLYGFFEQAEKDMFLHLISVSGVGTSTARMMLSAMKPEEIARAIINGNGAQLESIKGIGKKSAERIILELRDKVRKSFTDSNISPLINNSLEQDALDALIALGIAKTAADQALRKVLSAEPDATKVEDVIKKALKIL
ncbi:MAG TPA: Holliday junction branch migration protein RuvA [Puia sp.]|nr:Holliday junction branch migration protein RuvA [Puia sp.]